MEQIGDDERLYGEATLSQAQTKAGEEDHDHDEVDDHHDDKK